MSKRNSECPKCGSEIKWKDKQGNVLKYGSASNSRRKYCMNESCDWSGRPFDTGIAHKHDYLPEWSELDCGMILANGSEEKYLYLKEGESFPKGEGWSPIETQDTMPAVCVVALVLGKKVIHRCTATAGIWSIDGIAITDHLC